MFLGIFNWTALSLKLTKLSASLDFYIAVNKLLIRYLKHGPKMATFLHMFLGCSHSRYCLEYEPTLLIDYDW